MSKPLRRWQVMVGKYLGIIAAALMAVAILGLILILCTWWRLPGDYQLRTSTLDPGELTQIWNYRKMHISGLLPSLVLVWLQVSVLAAIGVAISTRVPLVVNLPVVILIYIAGNLTRFMFPLKEGSGGPLSEKGPIVKGVAYIISTILPYLENFDLRSQTVYSPIALAGTEFAQNPAATTLATIWGYTGYAALYALVYATFALAVGMWFFQTRELGGAEG
jgi:ABC-type transport system involved in multi-copper enzyme maturation permease subunit